MTLTSTLPQNAIPLEPLVAGTPPPRNRIKGPIEAQTLVTNLWQANKQRTLKDASVQAMFDGNPPYNVSKMRAAGRAGEANFNTLEASALLNTACVPYYDLFAGDRRYVDVKVSLAGMGNTDDQLRWGNAISEAFDRLLQSWDCFDEQMQSIITDFVAYGRGYAVFDGLKSWHFHKIAHHRVMVPDATPIDLDRTELIVVLDNYTVADLYGKLCDVDGNLDRATATSAGWNVDATLLAISGAVPVDPATPMDAMAAQQQLRDNDLYISARSSTVQTATLYVREFNGKWSELMVRRDALPTSSLTNGPAPAPSFLFEARHRHSHIREFINPFFFDVKESWNGISGLGRDIFTLMQLIDRVACAQANAVFLRNSLVLQPKQALDKSRMNLLQIGSVTWIPEGVDVHQGTILGDIASTLEVDANLRQRVERNTGIYRPTIEKGAGNPQTLGEFNAKFAQATVLSVSAVNRFYAQVDRLYQQMARRILAKGVRASDGPWADAVLKFRTELELAGVPPEVLMLDKNGGPSNLTIRAWRTIGNGSAAMRQQQLGQLMGLYSLLPATGQQNLLADIISVSGSASQLNRYLPASEVAKLPTDQQAMATLENAALRQGAPVLWTPSQNNIVHADTHLSAAGQAASSLQQGAPVADVLAFLDSVGAHIATHLQHESQNPTSKDHLKALTQQWQQLASFTDKLHKHAQDNAQQQQNLQQQAQDTMTDAKIKMLELQGNQALSRQKAAGLLQLKKERQDAELALKSRQQSLDTTLQTQAHITDLALKDAATAADIHRRRFEAVQKARIDAAKTTNGGSDSND